MKKLVIGSCIIIIISFVLIRYVNIQYEYPGWKRTVNISGSIISFTRSSALILTAKGSNNDIDLYKSLGWTHAHDRYVQLFLHRLAATGELVNHLPFSEASLKSDLKAKQMNLHESGMRSLQYIDEPTLKKLTAYTDGINHYLSTNPRPLEFVLLNYYPEPFRVSDVVSIINFISYAGLNDICLTLEKTILELVSETNIDVNILKKTFSPHLDGLNAELLDLYKSITKKRPLAYQDTASIPKLINSNNWVVSGKLSASGFPLMGSDPHMDTSKVPNIFYESHFIGVNGFAVAGLSVAGFPGYVLGRTPNLAFSLTFGMLDMADYYVERISNMHYTRDGKKHKLNTRTYSLKNGKVAYFYDTHDGLTIERDFNTTFDVISDGTYLATKFGISVETDIANSQLLGFWRYKSALEARKKLVKNSLGSNYLLADILGNIVYQQGGMVPKRRNKYNITGLLPLPAWDSENLWKGYLEPDNYKSIINPDNGFIATANNHIQADGKAVVTTFAALPYRVNRIKDRLSHAKEKLDLRYFKDMQSDTYSQLAARVIPHVMPFLGSSEIESLLKKWDFRSTVDSKPAAFFQMYYQNFIKNILRKLFHPSRADKYYRFAYYPMTKLVNTIILEGVVNNEKLDSVYRDTLRQTLEQYQGEKKGDIQKWSMKHLMFNGKLPAWLGLDTRPLATNHCEECIKVGMSRVTQHNMSSFISQAWRMVTDLGRNDMETALPGGPSGNILSNIYNGEVEMFLADQYKTIELGSDV